jgi:HEAT repeat protein
MQRTLLPVARGLAVALVVAACHKPPATFSDTLLTDVVVDVDAADPGEVLAEAVASSDPTPRARALSWLLKGESADAWLPVALHDASPWVQLAAVDALATRGAAGQPGLQRLADEGGTPIVRMAAALALPSQPPDRALGARLLADAEGRAPWHQVPLALAATAHGSSDAPAVLSAALATGELPLDLHLMRALGQHAPPSALDALATAQHRVPDDLQVALAAARLALGDDRAEAPLREALHGDSAQRMEALDALLPVVHPAVDSLVRRARQGASPLVGWHADLVMAARTGEDSPRLVAAFDEPDPEVRRLAVHLARHTLEHAPDSRRAARDARAALWKAIDDPDATVRAAAAAALGERMPSEALPALRALQTDESPIVRLEVAGALSLADPPAPAR